MQVWPKKFVTVEAFSDKPVSQLATFPCTEGKYAVLFSDIKKSAVGNYLSVQEFPPVKVLQNSHTLSQI